MTKEWHVTIARYSKKHNAVEYRRVKDFYTVDDGLKFLNKHQNKPIELWHTKAAELDNPYLAIVETEAYKQEHKKYTD